MKTVPSVEERYLRIDSKGETRINHELAWEDMHQAFLTKAATEGLDVERYQTVSLFKSPVTQARYTEHRDTWVAAHLGS